MHGSLTCYHTLLHELASASQRHNTALHRAQHKHSALSVAERLNLQAPNPTHHPGSAAPDSQALETHRVEAYRSGIRQSRPDRHAVQY